MQISARIVRNSTLRIAQFVLGLGISFFLMPFLVRHLGDRMYGLWTLVGSVLGYYGLIDFGLSSAVTRFISRAVGRDDKSEIRAVFCTSFYLFLALGLITACLTWALSAVLGFIVEDPADLHLFRMLLVVLGLNFSFDFPVRAFSAVFTSSLRDDLSVMLMIFKTVVSTCFVVWAIGKGYGVVALAIVTVSFSVIDSMARVVIARRIEPAISVDPRYFDRSKIRTLFGYSAYTFVGNIADILCYRLDSIVTTVGVGLQAVTHFFVAGRLVELMQQSLNEGVRSVGPVFSQDEGRNDYDSIRRRFRFLLKISLYFAVFACSMAIIYGRFFIERWMGDGYKDSYLVLVVLVGGYLIRLIQLPAIPLLYAISRHKYYTYTNLFEGASNLVISVYLVEKMGIVGVALGTAIPMTLTSIFALPWYVSKCVGFNQREYVFNILRHAAAAAVFIALGAVPSHFVVRASYPALIACLLIQTVLYWPLVARFGFTAEERGSLFQAVHKSMPFADRLSFLTTTKKKEGPLGA
jgi:O-antigen/teichoic acid export membrane protein